MMETIGEVSGKMGRKAGDLSRPPPRATHTRKKHALLTPKNAAPKHKKVTKQTQSHFWDGLTLCPISRWISCGYNRDGPRGTVPLAHGSRTSQRPAAKPGPRTASQSAAPSLRKTGSSTNEASPQGRPVRVACRSRPASAACSPLDSSSFLLPVRRQVGDVEVQHDPLGRLRMRFHEHCRQQLIERLSLTGNFL